MLITNSPHSHKLFQSQKVVWPTVCPRRSLFLHFRFHTAKNKKPGTIHQHNSTKIQQLNKTSRLQQNLMPCSDKCRIYLSHDTPNGVTVRSPSRRKRFQWVARSIHKSLRMADRQKKTYFTNTCFIWINTLWWGKAQFLSKQLVSVCHC